MLSPALGVVRLAPGVGLRRSNRPWEDCALRQPGPALSAATPSQGTVRSIQSGNGVPGVSGGNWKQFHHDDYDQEVNDTNTDPVSPSATGR